MSAKRTFRFRVYVAGDAPNSVRALTNLRQVCQTHCAGRHQIEVVDILKDPARALQDRIFLTPTLVKLAPAPVRQIVGNLSDTDTLRHHCGLDKDPS